MLIAVRHYRGHCFMEAFVKISHIISFLGFLAAIGGSAEVSAQTRSFGSRQKVPDAAALSAAEKVVKEVYKAEYAKKKTSEWVAFAKLLLKTANETKDDLAGQLVMY